MQIEVCYSNSLKINKGNYQQEAPFFSSKSVLDLPDQSTPEQVESAYKRVYEQLQGIVDPLLQNAYNSKRSDMGHLRIREKNGKKYPSVTSVLQPDPFVIKGKIPLEAYSERGNQADQIFKMCLTSGECCDPEVSKFAPLPWDYDIPKFISDNIDVFGTLSSRIWARDVEAWNEEYLYSGEIDLLSPTTLLDVKTGGWKWEQLVAYAKCIEPDVKTLAIADLKNNKLVSIDLKSEEATKAWEKFLVKRGEFLARFGI